ncbi:hypothetical protein GOZ92_19760 [Agrobacterium vitis]|nr:hypothetical protein [Agrobacterium vitis]
MKPGSVMYLDHEAAALGRVHSNVTVWLGGVLEVKLRTVFERLSSVVRILYEDSLKMTLRIPFENISSI